MNNLLVLLILFFNLSVSANEEVLIKYKHLSCSVDSDCEITYTVCSYGQCDKVINKIYLESHRVKLREFCKNYKGVV